MSDLFGKGYYLYVDNWCTSENLARYLLNNKTPMCGTAMPRRIKYPKSMKEVNLKRGKSTFRRDGNVILVHLQDKKELFFLSTIHSAEASRDKDGKEGKFVVNQDYNKYIGGVDKSDAIIGTYSSCCERLKWTTKVVIHMMEETMLNAFILYNKSTPGKKMRFLKFKLEYIRSILIPPRNENVRSHLMVPTRSINFLELIAPTPKKVDVFYATKKKSKEGSSL